jgi:hypothetical protein
MLLQVGDRLTDSTGEWEVIGRPYTTVGGKNSHVRVQRVDYLGTSIGLCVLWFAAKVVRH